MRLLGSRVIDLAISAAFLGIALHVVSEATNCDTHAYASDNFRKKRRSTFGLMLLCWVWTQECLQLSARQPALQGPALPVVHRRPFKRPSAYESLC